MVTPGFVDAHTHLIFGGNRANEFEMRCEGMTYQQISEQGGGIRSTVRSTRAATEAELIEIGRKHAEWFLRGGTTTIEAKSGYGLTVEDELKILRAVRAVGEETPLRCVPTFLGAHEVPEEYIGNAPRLRQSGHWRDASTGRSEKLARYCDVFCEPKVFPVATARQILAAAKARGLWIAGPRRPIHLLGRGATGGGAGREDRRPPRAIRRGLDCGAESCRRAAGAVAGFGLRDRLAESMLRRGR